MKIAEISTFSLYSVGKIMNDIGLEVLLNKGNEVKIFYARGRHNANNKAENIYFGNKIFIFLNAIIARIFDNDGFCLFSLHRKLIKLLKKYNPDIIHLHCLHGYYLNVNKFFKYIDKCGAKIVWTMHDAWAVTGHCCYFSMEGCYKWKKLCFNCPQKKEYPKSYVFDFSKRNYINKKKIFCSVDNRKMLLVTPSFWLKRVLDNSFLNKYKVAVVHNGINLYNFFNSNPTRKKVLIGVASVWDKRKNLSKFLTIAESLKNNWEIILVGKIDDDVIIPKYIEYHGRTSSVEDLVKLYNRSAILFNPTLDDNYPTINLEAQACGCKVVCYDVGGNKETNLGNLYLIDKNDKSDVFNCIFEEKFKKVENMNCDSKFMAKKYFELYNLLLLEK